MRSVRTFPRAANGMRASAVLGTRLRALREQKGFSQGDVEERTGLLRCYISSVEHSHTVPSIDTLEKIASALDVPLSSLFCEESLASLNSQFREKTYHRTERGPEEDRRFLRLLRRQVPHLSDRHRALLLFLARTMARIAANEKAANRQ